MTRLSRLVLSGFAYNVTQRGNRRLQTFFEVGDYELCRDLVGEAAGPPNATASFPRPRL